MNRVLKKIKNRLLSQNYFLLKNICYFQYRLGQDASKTPLIIYQMGKVGSSTIVNSLEKIPLNYSIYQVHVLTPEWIEKVHNQYKRASKIHKRAILDEHLLASMYLRGLLDKGASDGRWKVISLVRDPVSRNISCFFQAFPVYFPDEAVKYRNHDVWLDENIAELVELFINRFEEHDTPLRWFEIHMKPVFDIDVFESRFPWDKGYQIYNGEHADLLVIRLEDLDLCATRAFKEFLHIDNFNIILDNISNDKNYSTAYRLFKKAAMIPESMLDMMYDTKYMKHFYSKNEIDKLKEKWSKSS